MHAIYAATNEVFNVIKFNLKYKLHKHRYKEHNFEYRYDKPAGYSMRYNRKRARLEIIVGIGIFLMPERMLPVVPFCKIISKAKDDYREHAAYAEKNGDIYCHSVAHCHKHRLNNYCDDSQRRQNIFYCVIQTSLLPLNIF